MRVEAHGPRTLATESEVSDEAAALAAAAASGLTRARIGS